MAMHGCPYVNPASQHAGRRCDGQMAVDGWGASRLSGGQHDWIPEEVHGDGAEEVLGCPSKLCSRVQVC